MSRSRIAFATSLMLGAASQLWSWGQPMEPIHLQSAPAPKQPSFPLNENQEWFVKESYLLWHPYEDDVDWSARVGLSVDSDVDVSIRMKRPDFGWYSGARITVGRYLPHHDHWDISLATTYFYANTENHSSPKITSPVRLQPTSAFLYTQPSSGFSKGEGTWRLNFFTWDLNLGRNIFLSSKIATHPFLTLRGVLIYENDGSRLSFGDSFKFRFKGFNDFWGIGPRLGSDFTYYMNTCWTLLGSFSGSVLLGSYKVGEHLSTFDVGSHLKRRATVRDSGFAVRGNLEGSLGLGWEKWVHNGRVRIAPSVVVEAAQWYDMNQRLSIGNIRLFNVDPIDRHHGDLTLWGFNFNLQVDF